MLTRWLLIVAVTAVWALPVEAATNPQAETVRELSVQDLDLSSMSAGWGTPQKNTSVTKQPLRIAGVTFANGIGTHANSEFYIQLDGRAQLISAKVGVDDNAGGPCDGIEFLVYGDDRQLWRSGVCRLKDAAKECRIPLAGVKLLQLSVETVSDNNRFAHADWADAQIQFAGQPPRPEKFESAKEEPIILTPPAPRTPRIHGPAVYGVRPGSPVLYRIPCTGERPLEFRAEGLPAGLALDSASGIISGKIAVAGKYSMTLVARNSYGQADREFRIVVGHTLALTPPMGWNSWYIHYNRVSDSLMRQAADQMIASGMADYGYQYVNVDDCWMKKRGDEPYRNAAGAVLPNAKFHDMKGLADYIHGKGLKAGLYTSPGPWTCGDYVGAWQHEAADAREFAEWGYDFLKYDWCSYGSVAGGNDLAHFKRPYQVMTAELQKQDRDIVFNLCQYGMGDVWKWGGEVGNSWRTTDDLGMARGSRLPGFYSIGLSNAKHWEFARPGAWNDPDYILIGWVGDAARMSDGKQTTLTPNEQYSYMSLWSLMAAPLIFSGDMRKLDAFTLNILCNSEIIGVDQDPLGRQAKTLRQSKAELVFVKDLEGGAKAVGLFNLGEHPAKIGVSWIELGISGNWRVRDLWRQEVKGVFKDSYVADVPRHGVTMIRIDPERDERRIK